MLTLGGKHFARRTSPGRAGWIRGRTRDTARPSAPCTGTLDFRP